MAPGGRDDCPACGAGTDCDRWCGVCGLDLEGVEAGELRGLATELAASEAELNAIRVHRDALATDLARRRWQADRRAADVVAAVPAFELRGRPPSTPVSGEWDVERVRNLLLWTGATLLALSALAFTAVAWTHLGPGGRALLLVAITVVSALLASGFRRRLPATAGAFTGLTIALALVDWQVARRAGAAPTLSSTAWWAIGTAVVAALSAVLGRIASPVPAHRAIAVLVPGSAVLTVAAIANAAWSGALGLAMIAAALVAADQVLGSRIVDPVVRATLRASAGVVWVVSAVFALGAALAPTTFVQTLAPAAVVLALAAAPGLVVARSRDENPSDHVAMAFLVLAAAIGAALTLASTSVGPVGMLTFAVVLGSAWVAAAPSLTDSWRRAAQIVGVAAAGAGFVFAVVEASVGELGPLAWLANSWTGTTRARAVLVVAGPNTVNPAGLGWCAVAILAVAAVALAIACVPRRGAPRPFNVPSREAEAAGLALVAIVLSPIAAGASALMACALATGAMSLALFGSAIATRRHPERALPSGLVVLLPAAPAAGWAALTPRTSITVLAIAAASALLAAAVGRAASLRAAHAGFGAAATIGLASVVTLASGGPRPVAGFVGVVVAGAVLLVGSLARRDTADGLAVEIVGGVGMLCGALLAVPSRVWVGAALTAMVPLLLGASMRRGRTVIYGAAAGGAALSATWVWLANADVTVVEAYTLSAAACALGAGTLAWKVGRARSWLNLGPALVLALAPTLLLAIVRNDDGRAIAVGIAALSILLLGAWQRLQAPLVLGTLTLLALGVDKLGPQAVRLPRWMMLAIAGALLLWVGTTFERRRDDVERAARRLVELG